MSTTSQPSRGRAAIAALIVVLVVFGASFAVRKATAGSAQAAPLPATVVVPSTPVHISGIAVPATPPALRRPPHPSTPASTPAPASTPTPATTPESTSTPTPAPSTPSKPAAPSGGKGSGPVLVG